MSHEFLSHESVEKRNSACLAEEKLSVSGRSEILHENAVAAFIITGKIGEATHTVQHPEVFAGCVIVLEQAVLSLCSFHCNVSVGEMQSASARVDLIRRDPLEPTHAALVRVHRQKNENGTENAA